MDDVTPTMPLPAVHYAKQYVATQRALNVIVDEFGFCGKHNFVTLWLRYNYGYVTLPDMMKNIKSILPPSTPTYHTQQPRFRTDLNELSRSRIEFVPNNIFLGLRRPT